MTRRRGGPRGRKPTVTKEDARAIAGAFLCDQDWGRFTYTAHEPRLYASDPPKWIVNLSWVHPSHGSSDHWDGFDPWIEVCAYTRVPRWVE